MADGFQTPTGGLRGKTWRLLERFESRRMPLAVAAVAFVLALPTLGTGFFLDDRYHEYVLRGLGAIPGGARGAWDLYRFADATEAVREAVRTGWYPWWTNPDLKLAFFRPIPALWRYVDFHLWNNSAVITHLETCIAYGVLAFVAARAYRVAVGGAAAGIAALAFAIDDGHAIPVVWISNRYAIVAAAFAFGALFAHVRARTEGGGKALGPVLFGLAMLSGETALGVLGYLLGYALFVDKAGRRAGLVALAPYAAIAATWALAYRTMGYGSKGSTFYVDPTGAPALFLKKIVVRYPQLAVSGVLGPPADIWLILPEAAIPIAVALGAVVAVLVVALVARTATRADPAVRGVVTALVFGAAVALVPVCATLPDDRNFMIAGFGFFGVLGLALAAAWRGIARLGFIRGALIALIAVVHLVIAPLLLPLRAVSSAAMFRRFIARSAATLPARPDVDGKNYIMVGVPDALLITFVMLEPMLGTGPKMRTGTILSVQTKGKWTADFSSEDTVVIQNPEGCLHSLFAGVYTDRPYSVGQVFDREVDRVEVLELSQAGEPTKLSATIRLPKTQRVWLVWEGLGFKELPAPRAGDKLEFEGVDLFSLLQHE